MKNLQLTLLLLATTFTAFSQLYIAPNAVTSTDSYIYVSNEILFVEDDIDLTENPNNATTKASIYLRNDSQLIQGTGLTPNSGTGYISVYQTVDETSNYHYNFWHSPVGNQTLANSGNQKAGVSRLYEIVDVTDSNLAATITSSNGDNSPLTISTRWIYTRESSPVGELEANYIHIGGTDEIAPGYGFTMKGVSDGTNTTISYEYDFRGRPNNSSIDVPVNIGNQWTLSGNPYPSAIDLVEFFNDNSGNGLTEILFWDEPKNIEYSHNYMDKSGGYGTWIPGSANSGNTDPGSYVAPTFKTYSATGGIGGNAGTGTGAVINRRYSPIGQGFVLSTNAVAATNIVHSNSHRTYTSTLNVRSSDNNGNKTQDNSLITPTPESLLTPQIRMNVVINQEYARQLLLLFSDESTDGYDVGLDGHHPMDSGGAESYFLIEENGELEPFVIQTRPYDSSIQIPIGFTLDSPTYFNVKAVDVINFNRETFLWDSLNDTYKVINTEPQSNINSFYLTAGTYNNRFFIVFKNSKQVLGDSDGTKKIELVRASVDFFQNNPYKQMEISNPDGYNIKNAKIFDMAGKLVINKNNLGNSNKLTVGTSNLADGVYLIKLLTSENINIDYKMIIKNN